MKTLIALALLAAPVFAQDEDPTYQECFEMAQKSMKVEMDAMKLEHDALFAKGVSAPATIKSDQQKQLEDKIRDQGVTLKIDPAHPSATPGIELPNTAIPGMEKEDDQQEEDQPDLSDYDKKRKTCKALYGLSY